MVMPAPQVDDGRGERRLRVCIVAACPVPYPRGTPVRVTRFAEALAARGHEVHLLTYGFGSGVIDSAVHVHRGPRLSLLDPRRAGPSVGKLAVLDPILVMQLRSLLKRYPFDVIHAHHYEGLLAALAASRSRVPVVYDAHTVLETELPSYGGRLTAGILRRVGGWIDRTVPARARFVVAASHRLKDYLVDNGVLPEERVAAIGNGIELSALSMTGEPRAAAGGEGVLAYAGNLAPFQGIDKLLEAFQAVSDARPGARLRVLTDCSFEPYEGLARDLKIRRRIELKRVPFERLPSELEEVHVAVNPRPRCDGVPMKNLNYMAASRPLVGFADSLHPAVDRRSGIAVHTVCGQALGERILWLLDRPDEGVRLGREARLTVERDYTWPRQAARVEAVYQQLLEPAP